MIIVKNNNQIELMRKAGIIVRDTLNKVLENIKVGVSTKKLDDIAREYIHSCNAKPSFLGYGGYPASLCVSINEEVVHGIPSDKRIIKEGDLVSIDVGAIYQGYHGDAARSMSVNGSEADKRLISITEKCFFDGVSIIKAGIRLGDLGSVIQNVAESNGYGVVRALVGHGIGADMHEDPQVPNYGQAGRGTRLQSGMTIAVEPMINAGTYEVTIDSDDGWTVRTKDGKKSAHYENTVLVTENGYELLTL